MLSQIDSGCPNSRNSKEHCVRRTLNNKTTASREEVLLRFQHAAGRCAARGGSQLPTAIAPPRALGQCALLQCDAPASWFAVCFNNLGMD